MKRNFIPKLLLSNAFILFCGYAAHSQGWVGDGTNKLYPVNSGLGLTPVSIGIGTTSPTDQFHTTGSVRFQGLTQNDTTARILTQDANGKLFWRNAATFGSGPGSWALTGNAGTNPASNFLGTTDNQRLVFRTNNTERATILGNGYIGVGTIAPVRRLHVHNSTGEDNNIIVSGNSPSVYFMQTETYPPYPYNIPISKVGLATRSGAYVETAQAGDMIALAASPNASVIIGTGVSASNNGIERMRINGQGYVGITTITPTANLHVKGTVRFENLPAGSGDALVIDAYGNVRRGSSTGTTGGTSSAQIDSLKQEIAMLKQAIVDIQNQLASKQGSIDIVPNSSPILLTNAPNPFSGTTKIVYSFPAVTKKAYVKISDLNGKILKSIDVSGASSSSVSVTSDTFPASGTYIYSLEVDGNVATSKKLMVTK